MDDGDKSRRRVVKVGAESTIDQSVQYHGENCSNTKKSTTTLK